MEKKEPHYHKYIRKRFKSGYTIYKCTTCRHYIHENLLVGREALCWRCNRVFTAVEKDATLKKPHCLNCTRGREEDLNIADGAFEILSKIKGKEYV